MNASVGTVVIGAGQAGLAMSRCLSDRGLPHVVLERGAVGEQLGRAALGVVPAAEPELADAAAGPPLRRARPGRLHDRRRGGRVPAGLRALVRRAGAHRRRGAAGAPGPGAGGGCRPAPARIDADAVVVATGDLARPRLPAIAAALPPGLRQVHAGDYRRPAQLPDGAVLVVGAGPSGQQIARELAARGTARAPRGRAAQVPAAALPRPRRLLVDGPHRDARAHRGLAAGRRPGRAPRTRCWPAAPATSTCRRSSRRAWWHTAGCATSAAAWRSSPTTWRPPWSEARSNADRFRATVDAFVAAHGIDVPEEPVPGGRRRAARARAASTWPPPG